MKTSSKDGKRKKKCEVCKKPVGEKDFYELCRNCQPAWRVGFEIGRELMASAVRNAIEKEML
jgi:hypothetical protein